MRTYNLIKPDLPVQEGGGKTRKLADLREEDRVLLKVIDEDVVAIRLAGPQLFGPLLKADLVQRTVTVRTKIGDKVAHVAASAKIHDQNQNIALEDLKPGRPCWCRWRRTSGPLSRSRRAATSRRRSNSTRGPAR